jgi:hypothetical protein
MIKRKRRKPNDTVLKSGGEYSSPACLMHEFDPEQTAAGVPGVRIKRIYEDPERTDGFRVLVDRTSTSTTQRCCGRLSSHALLNGGGQKND